MKASRAGTSMHYKSCLTFNVWHVLIQLFQINESSFKLSPNKDTKHRVITPVTNSFGDIRTN